MFELQGRSGSNNMNRKIPADRLARVERLAHAKTTNATALLQGQVGQAVQTGAIIAMAFADPKGKKYACLGRVIKMMRYTGTGYAQSKHPISVWKDKALNISGMADQFVVCKWLGVVPERRQSSGSKRLRRQRGPLLQENQQDALELYSMKQFLAVVELEESIVGDAEMYRLKGGAPAWEDLHASAQGAAASDKTAPKQGRRKKKRAKKNTSSNGEKKKSAGGAERKGKAIGK